VTGPGTGDYTRDREGTALISDFTEPRPHAKARAALIVVASVAAVVAALVVFRIRVAPEDARPHFRDERVEAQVYVVGEEIELKLPAARRANGPLTYSLYPRVPGLSLSGTTLQGTPAEPGTYSMVYTVVDADDDTTGRDKDWLTFTILVESPRTEWSFRELGADIDAVDYDGTALCKAARHAGAHAVRTLLALGADPNVSYRGMPRTHPISCALRSRKPLAEMRLIMQALADGGAVIPRGGISFGEHPDLGSDDLRSLLRPFFERRRLSGSAGLGPP